MFGSKVPELKICIRLKQTRRSLLTRNENLFEQNFITFLTLSLSILKFVDKLLRRQHLSVYMKCRVEYQSDDIMIKSVNSGLQKGKIRKRGQITKTRGRLIYCFIVTYLIIPLNINPIPSCRCSDLSIRLVNRL